MTNTESFQGRLGLQQRVLPDYRAAFFDLLAGRCEGGFGVYAGQPKEHEGVHAATGLAAAELWNGRNLHFLSGSLYLCFQTDLMEWLRRWNPDVLIMEANPRYLSSRRAANWMRAKGRPVVGWGLGIGRSRSVWAPFLKRFDALIAYSSQGAEEYRQAGFPAERVFVAPNATTAAPAELQPKDWSDPPNVLFVGRLQQRKRVDLLLKACKVQALQPRLWIVGDGPARTALERLAETEYPNATFTGALRGDDLDEIFRQADLFVLPGTGGLAVQQAMAHGLPVIVAEADGSQRDLVDPENGWLVPPGDLEALTQALRDALDNPDRLPRMGEASYHIVSERVNIEVMAEVFLEAVRRASRA